MRNINALFQAKPSLHIGWPKKLDLSALRRQRRNAKDRTFDPVLERVSSLQTSFSVFEGIQNLKERKWSFFDAQYFILATICFFSLWIIDVQAPFIKSAAVLLYTLLLLMPATSQFFLPSWPIWTYLLYFFSSR